MLTETMTAACRYSLLGWSIIPILHRSKVPCVSWRKYQRERADSSRIESWFAGRDDLGLAVIFGPVSGGLACRDFDERTAYERWCAGHPDLAATLPTVQTHRGFHVYFRSTRDVGIVRLRDGELRTSRGYCVLPPSTHPAGDRYEWIVPIDGDIPVVDTDLMR